MSFRKERLVIIGSIILLFSNCGPCKDDTLQKGIFSPSEVKENIDTLAGQRITIRGYFAYLGDLYIFDRKTTYDNLTPRILARSALTVLDNSSDGRILSETEHQGIVCTGHYAEIVGVLWLSDAHRAFVLWDLHSIRIFENEEFEGPGTLCYQKDANSKIFLPLETLRSLQNDQHE